MQISQERKNVSTIVDSQTGDIIDQIVQVDHQIISNKKVKNYNEFILVYLQDLSSFLQLDNATQIKLLALMWRDCQYTPENTDRGNVITVLKDDKEKWANEIGVTVRTIENTLSSLIKKDLLLSICKGKYELNPLYYFKGKSNDRKRVLNMRVVYEIEENTEFETDGEN